jgi:hypothetical protein
MSRWRPAHFANAGGNGSARVQSGERKNPERISAPVCVRRCRQKWLENFTLTQRYDRYTIAAVISMRVRFEPGRSSAMRAKSSRLRGLLKIKRRRECKPSRSVARGAADVEKTHRASRVHTARGSAGRVAARVEVRRVSARLRLPVSVADREAGISPMRGKAFALPAGSRSNGVRNDGSRIGRGKNAVRVAVGVGHGSLVIVIVQRNCKQEFCN